MREMGNLIVVISNFPCSECEQDTPHVYQDQEERLLCLRCRMEGRDTAIKLVDPGVVIGRYIQN